MAHDREIRDYLVSELGYGNYKGCYQALYDRKEKLPLKGTLIFHNPDMSEFEKFLSTYEIGDDEMKREEFASPGFFGAYIKDDDGKEEMVGYVGEHLEGSIGMLYVFPEWRGRGFALEMQSYMLNRALEMGAYSYGQIFEDNEASIALSRKMGLKFSDGMVYWTWKEM